jgi:hypothetical protein
MFWQYESSDDQSGWEYHTGDGGGNVRILNGKTPNTQWGNGAVSFGPLRISPWKSTTVVIDDLSFDVLDEQSVIPFLQSASGMPTQPSTAAAAAGTLALPFLASVEDDDPETQTPLTRRDMMIATGVTATAATLGTGTVAAQEEEDDGTLDSTRYVAEFELAESTRGIQIGIDDRVDQFLPVGEKYYVELNGSVVDSFKTGANDSARFTIGPGITGRVRVVAEDGVSLWRKILADFSSGEPLTYTFNLEQPVSERDRGAEIVITDQPIVVDALQDAGEDETVLKINDTAISNLNNGSSSRGNWYVRDDPALVYEVGVDAPDSSVVELTINAGWRDSISARVDELL